MLPAFLGHRAHQRDELGHIPADFVFEDFRQRDVRRAHVADVQDERTAQAAAAGVQLAHAARHDVHEDIRVANFFIGAFAKFSVHGFSDRIERDRITAARVNATRKLNFVGASSKGDNS
jgi:hypothetical protein